MEHDHPIGQRADGFRALWFALRLAASVASLRFALLSSVSIALLVAELGCSAAETSPESFGGAGGTSGSGGTGGAGSGGTGGFAGYAAGGGVGGSSGTGGSGGSAGLDGGSGGSSGSSAVCVAMPACDAPLPNVGSKRSWKHTSSIFVASGFANHRGRDLLLMPQSEQWIIGKFAYGIFDDDLKDEEVDIWLNRECGSSWEKLATVLTTEENAHPSVEGVTDSGGRVYFQIPADKKLGIGRHRVRLVVGGDLSGADVYIEVLPSGVPFFVADVDGTLTSEETEEYGALLTSSVSDARPAAGTRAPRRPDRPIRPRSASGTASSARGDR